MPIRVETRLHNYLYGDGLVDADLGAPATLGMVNTYRDLVINAGVTFDHTGHGIPVVRCSGTLTVIGNLHANGLAYVYDANAAAWGGTGGDGARILADGLGPNIGGSSFALGLGSALSGLHFIPTPGGGGGDSAPAAGDATPCVFEEGIAAGAHTRSYRPDWAAQVVAVDADGDSILTDPVDALVNPELGIFAVGAGGGCGADAVPNYIAGGDGGGVVCIFARQIEVRAGGLITARGMDGANAGLANQGGGGGGGGGTVYIVTEHILNSGTIDAAGGTGGTANGTGQVGGAGSDGAVRILTA